MPLDSDPTPPPAVAAFLRGLERRAGLLARVQSGEEEAALRALRVTARVFAADAGQWPLAQWPGQYWRLLLSAPAMARAGSADGATTLPGIARLPAASRAAVLLHLVAGLEDGDAAVALGIDIASYQQRIRDALPRDALNQPDLDVWRAWQAAVKRALDNMPLAATSTTSATPQDAAPASPPSRRRMRWLWPIAIICALALLAGAFLHPRGRTLLERWQSPPIRSEPLPAAEAPKARFDADDPALDPDAALLAAPRELQLATRLGLLAWLSATADAELATATPPISTAVTPAPDLPQWSRLSLPQRAVLRQAWAQWQALPEAERAQLRATATRFDALPAEQQQALRTRHAQLPFDARQGWLLGPTLGPHWPPVAALFAQVEGDERAALLKLLRDCSSEETAALARLAQTTPPQERATLRRDLLAQAPAQRLAWLQARLQRAPQ